MPVEQLKVKHKSSSGAKSAAWCKVVFAVFGCSLLLAWHRDTHNSLGEWILLANGSCVVYQCRVHAKPKPFWPKAAVQAAGDSGRPPSSFH